MQGAGTNIHMQGMDLDRLTPSTKTSSKWTIDINVKGKTLKLLEANTGENLEHIGFADEFLGVTDIVHEKN